MASTKKTTGRRLGTPPSQRRTRSPGIPIAGFGFPIPAVVALDIPRIQGVWREWFEAGITDRHWDLEAYLELLRSFIQQGNIDWGGMEDLKPTVLDVLEQVRAGVLTPEEFQGRMSRAWAPPA